MALTSLQEIRQRPQSRAVVRYLRRSPYKVRQVLNLVRGKSVEDARQILEFCEREAATEVLALLESAAANAEHNHQMLADECYVAVAFCDEGPTMKRFSPRARGRAGKILKRTSHITIVLARYTDDELRGKASESGSSGAAARRRELRRRRVEAATAAAAQDHDHEVDEATPKASRESKAAASQDGTNEATHEASADDASPQETEEQDK